MKELTEVAAMNYAHNYFNMHETNNYKALEQGFNAGAEWNEKSISELVSLLKTTTEYEVSQSFRDKVSEYEIIENDVNG